MKNYRKILVCLLVIMLMVASFAPMAFAKDTDNVGVNPNEDEKTEVQETKKDEQAAQKQAKKDDQEAKKDAFEAGKLERNEVKTATKTELKEQKDIVKERKLELKEFKAALFEGMTEEEREAYIENMTEEERVAYKEEIDPLRLQIKDAQKYHLEIKVAEKEQIREIYASMKANGLPTEEEVDEVEEILDDLI